MALPSPLTLPACGLTFPAPRECPVDLPPPRPQNPSALTSSNNTIINAVMIVKVALPSGLTCLTYQGAASPIVAHPAMVRRRPQLRLVPSQLNYWRDRVGAV